MSNGRVFRKKATSKMHAGARAPQQEHVGKVEIDLEYAGIVASDINGGGDDDDGGFTLFIKEQCVRVHANCSSRKQRI